MKHLHATIDFTELMLSPQRVKFLLSIIDHYEFICPGLPMYYDPVTYQPAYLLDRLTGVYRADFLLRHRENSRAYLVDLVPSFLKADSRLSINRRIVNRYIHWKEYDWVYKVVFDDEITLSASKTSDFDVYQALTKQSDRQEWLIELMHLTLQKRSAYFSSANYSVLDFLIRGFIDQPSQ